MNNYFISFYVFSECCHLRVVWYLTLYMKRKCNVGYHGMTPLTRIASLFLLMQRFGAFVLSRLSFFILITLVSAVLFVIVSNRGGREKGRVKAGKLA